jgi:hypothetical protein
VAIGSFETWRAALDLDRLDSGSLSLMPLLFRKLREWKREDPILARLKGAHHFHWCKNQVRLRNCFVGIDALQAAGIRLVALKGLAALEDYGDPGLRPMADVDVLVPRDQGRMALETLIAAGFRLNHGKDPGELAELMVGRHGFGLGQAGAEIDVHWSSLIEDMSSSADEGLWSRAEPRALFGRNLLVPGVVDRLLHTCVHGARFSRAMSVSWVPDVVLLLSMHQGKLDWDLLVTEARRRLLGLPVRETLRFVREVLRRPVPQEVLDALEPPEPTWLFWLEHAAFATDPLQGTAWHRAAARVVARLRRGEPLPSDLVPPSAQVAHDADGSRRSRRRASPARTIPR